MEILKSSAVKLLSTNDDMDIDDAMIAEVLTPTKSKQWVPMEMDEDSGLGMEFEANPSNEKNDITDTPVTFNLASSVGFDILQSCESDCSGGEFRLRRQRRRLLQDDNEGSYCKRRHYQANNKKTFSKKSLSFGDIPLPSKQEAEVISAVNRLSEKQNITGDGRRDCCLPTIVGKHSDLQNITNDTVVDLISGKYDDVIGHFQLIDCRYPYEYEAGHVQGAINIYKQEKVTELLQENSVAKDIGDKRHILVFYCEFSSERGPKMCRKLRSADRDLNSENYPHLTFPEIYVMHNGYKAFYESQKEFCVPQDYKPMLHKDHAEDLRHFRSKSKSWTAGEKRRSGASKLLF